MLFFSFFVHCCLIISSNRTKLNVLNLGNKWVGEGAWVSVQDAARCWEPKGKEKEEKWVSRVILESLHIFRERPTALVPRKGRYVQLNDSDDFIARSQLYYTDLLFSRTSSKLWCVIRYEKIWKKKRKKESK